MGSLAEELCAAAPQPLDPAALPTPKMERWRYTDLRRRLPNNLGAGEESQDYVFSQEAGAGSPGYREIVWRGRGGIHAQPKLDVRLAPGTALVLVERCDGRGAYWNNISGTIRLGAGARLIHIRLQNEDPHSLHTQICKVCLDRGAYYQNFTLNSGADLSRYEMRAVLQGAGAECRFSGICLQDEGRLGDITLDIEHLAPDCRSDQNYRYLLAGQARGVFQGRIHVAAPAQKTQAHQLAKALQLSDLAEMDCKPEMEIYADDVVCTHGAATGQLDAAQLFYLRTRGIGQAQARRLLSRAFAAEALRELEPELDRLENVSAGLPGKLLRDEIDGILDGWLAEHL